MSELLSPNDAPIPTVCPACSNDTWFGPALVKYIGDYGVYRYHHYYECKKCNHFVTGKGKPASFEGGRN